MLTNTEESILKRCSKCGCNKLLKFFKIKESTGLYYKTCISCCEKSKEERAKYVKKCKCGKTPIFGFESDNKRICCSECKEEGMIDLINKKCKCGSVRPSLGFESDKRPTCCSDCKEDGMINIVSKRCKCGTVPAFGFETDKKRICCSECKEEGMIDLVNKKCKCKKIPTFGFESDKRPTRCSECKEDGMINIKHKKCKTPLCDIRASNRLYKGYCSRCFYYTFPDEKLTRNYKNKERLTTEHVKEQYPDYDWVCDRKVKEGCSLKRPDIYCDFGSHTLVIEVDEDRHSNYSCENKRMMELFQDFGNRPLVMIRFNPDSYEDEKTKKKIKSCFTIKRATGKLEVDEKRWVTRLKVLDDTINKYNENFQPKKEVSIEQLFYS